MKLLQKICTLMRLILNAVQGRRAHSARYPETLLRPSGATILAVLPTMQARCLDHHWNPFNRELL